MIERTVRGRISRRKFLAVTGVAAAAGPFIWTGRSSAAGKVIIRTIGGSYEEAVVKSIVEPFTKATGIEVVKVPATSARSSRCTRPAT
jgi:putative spermidine/putrescine transport system substrate-binding protein